MVVTHGLPEFSCAEGHLKSAEVQGDVAPDFAADRHGQLAHRNEDFVGLFGGVSGLL
jgi:hypothetical protein